MLIKSVNLIGLKVITESGQNVGRVKDFVIDLDNLKIKQLVVSKSKILANILVKELIIGDSQIIKITEKEVVVNDNLIKVNQTQEQAVSI